MPFVQRLEVVATDVDLATHFHHRRRGLDASQTKRNLRDGADVLRHVLAGFTVAARGRLDEHAMLIAQIDREAVEFEFGGVFDGRSVLVEFEFASNPRIESHCAARFSVCLGADGQHRHGMLHRRESGQDLADHALRR